MTTADETQSNNQSTARWVRQTLGSLFLMTTTPLLVYAFWFTAQYLDGSFALLYKILQKHGVGFILSQVSPRIFTGSAASWSIATIFIAFETALYLLVPGKTIYGPKTKSGFAPAYKENGFSCFLITMATFFLGSMVFKLFSPTIVFDHLGELIGTMFWMGILLCIALYIKGRTSPSPGEYSVSNNPIFDFFWGIELYPTVFGINIKHITNCRVGMMSWAVIIVSYAAQQNVFFGLSNSMLVSVALQLIYVGKFFIGEKGYLRSMDIAHDRAGYYICWGVLVWLPFIYTSPALYLLHHPYQLSNSLALSIFLLGTVAIAINYLADRQRVSFREKNGDLNVWGKKPQFTVAPYINDEGEKSENLLLASGYWGIARHFHYIPEILASFLWTLPALFNHIFPYFYVVYLTILLFDRAKRDDLRCLAKYGEAWVEHCKKVPYKIFPYIY